MKYVVQIGDPWPFKHMQVGDVAYCLDRRAQTYAHAYGRQTNRTFKTKTVKSKSGQLGVRVECTSMKEALGLARAFVDPDWA